MRAVVALGCLLVACGDNHELAIDAMPDAIDAAPDGPPPPPGCDWGELADIDNRVTPETTNLAFGSQLVMCGEVDIGHANPTTTEIDADAFGFSLQAARTIRVALAGTGLEALGRVELAIVNRFGEPITTSTFVGAHAVVAASLPAGSYGVAVRALGSEPTAAVAYTATITADTSTCMAATTDYTEAGDGGGTGNDMIDVRFTGDPALRRVLTAAADTPEPTGITVTTTARIAGTSADVDAADEFRDRDTYAFTTGPGIDTLTVRLDWAATTADLDVLVFPAGSVPELAGSAHIAPTGPEQITLAVLPSTAYWVWIGSYDSSSGLPVSYDASLCAE